MKKMLTIIALFTAIALSGCSGPRPADLGPRDGQLAPCPDIPNCVSSQSTDASQAVAPLTYSANAADAFKDLKKIINQMNRTVIVTETSVYMHAEVTSALFRFVDDLEFLVDDKEKKIHVRSSSRAGYSDLGVNSRRVEKIRRDWEKRREP